LTISKKRILFLFSDTGGGHRRAAQAISEAIAELYPHQFEIIIEDILQQYGGWPFSQIPRGYAWSIHSALPVWKLLWAFTWYAPVYKFITSCSVFLIRRSFQRYFARLKPDIVISVHPILNHSGLRILREAGIDCPFVTVVTDLTTVHPAWIYPEVIHCFVSTDIARNQAIGWGMPADKIILCGQPVSPRFITSNADKQRARQALGLETTCPTVLITGGGEGDSRMFDIAQRLVCSDYQAQLLVVAGRNHQLRTRLESLTRSKRLHLYGFVDNMPELMQAADILITKAGPGTISEALVMGVPMILYGYIPGQEEGNIAYIQKHQAGVYVEQPADIAELVLKWTTWQRSILAQMAQNAANLAYPLASYRIAEHVYRLVQSPQAEGEFRR
jgi:1,2-diacylglycerol 3-beta-galactosyltransferase